MGAYFDLSGAARRDCAAHIQFDVDMYNKLLKIDDENTIEPTSINNYNNRISGYPPAKRRLRLD